MSNAYVFFSFFSIGQTKLQSRHRNWPQCLHCVFAVESGMYPRACPLPQHTHTQRRLRGHRDEKEVAAWSGQRRTRGNITASWLLCLYEATDYFSLSGPLRSYRSATTFICFPATKGSNKCHRTTAALFQLGLSIGGKQKKKKGLYPWHVMSSVLQQHQHTLL